MDSVLKTKNISEEMLARVAINPELEMQLLSLSIDLQSLILGSCVFARIELLNESV